MAIRSTKDFGAAFCAHFNLPASQVLDRLLINTSPNDIFSATVTIAITPADMVGISAQMEGKPAPGEIVVLPAHEANAIRSLLARFGR